MFEERNVRADKWSHNTGEDQVITSPAQSGQCETQSIGLVDREFGSGLDGSGMKALSTKVYSSPKKYYLVKSRFLRTGEVSTNRSDWGRPLAYASGSHKLWAGAMVVP